MEKKLSSKHSKKDEKFFVPLADRMRPRNIEEFVGQDHLLGEGKVLRVAIETDKVSSLILWGPPGSGKTSLAYLIAKYTNSQFISFSAVTSGIKEIKEVIKSAEDQLQFFRRKTILFIDEIHRFNRVQQDAFLPYVEKGTIILIGATTENPSFEINSPLLSRCTVYTLNPLTEEQLEQIMNRALLDKERGLGEYLVSVEEEAKKYIINLANGDARAVLNTLEVAAMLAKPDSYGKRKITLAIAQEAIQKRVLLYDKGGEEHYNLISALHKSLRGSDPDAALYWLARMLEAGEDPLYIARRLIRFASEDIGNADPQALSLAIAAKDAVDFVGLPEADLALAQAVIYLACAPKSNAVYTAYLSAKEDVKKTIAEPVPLHIRNAPTNLMAQLGYGEGYKYPHNYPNHFVNQEYFPPNLKGRIYYYPTNQGKEAEISRRLANWRLQKKKAQKDEKK